MYYRLATAFHVAGLIPKVRPLFCRVPKRWLSRTPWHNRAHPPVSVYGTDPHDLTLEDFLVTTFPRISSDEAGFRPPFPLWQWICLLPDWASRRAYPESARGLAMRPFIGRHEKCRNINLLVHRLPLSGWP